MSKFNNTISLNLTFKADDISKSQDILERKNFFLNKIKSPTKKYKRYLGSPLRYGGGKTLAVGHILEFLPADIKNAIRYHHDGVFTDGFESQTAVVHIANIGAKILNMGVSGNDIIEKPNPIVWKKLGLPKNSFVNNFLPIMNDYQQSLQLFLL